MFSSVKQRTLYSHMRKCLPLFLGADRLGYSAHTRDHVHILLCDKISKNCLEVLRGAESYHARNTFPEVTQGVCCKRESLF